MSGSVDWGPLQTYLDNPEINEIMVINEGEVWVEDIDGLQMVASINPKQTQQCVEQIARSSGRRIDLMSPILDARMSDGSRACVVIPPISVDGPTISIRKFSKRILPLASFGPAAATDIVKQLITTRANIVITATGNRDIVTGENFKMMNDKTIVCNIGHFDNEIDVASLEKCKWDEIKPQVDHIVFPDGKKITLLAKGRLVNLGCATGHPSFVMSASFANQTIAQIELFTKQGEYESGKVYVLPKHLDEKVARLHLEKVGAMLTELTEEQAAYIGVSKAGPYKADTYRY